MAARASAYIRPSTEIKTQAIKADLKEFAGDLSKPEAIEQLIHNFPDVDILINNLGIFEPKTVSRRLTIRSGSACARRT